MGQQIRPLVCRIMKPISSVVTSLGRDNQVTLVFAGGRVKDYDGMAGLSGTR